MTLGNKHREPALTTVITGAEWRMGRFYVGFWNGKRVTGLIYGGATLRFRRTIARRWGRVLGPAGWFRHLGQGVLRHFP